MDIDRLINLLLTLTLIVMMTGIGMGVEFADIAAVATNRGLLLRAGFANYVCVPLISVGLLIGFNSPPMIAAGFLIVAVCPGAPYGPAFTALAGGKMSAAVGLMVILAASSVILGPLLLRVLLPLMTEGQPLKINAVRMVRTLLVSQLLPLSAGLCARHWRPALAERSKPPLDRLSTVLNVCVLGLILVVHFHTLAAIRLMGYVGMLALVLCSLAAGWLLSEPGSDNRKAMGFATAVRNVAVSLVIATASFPDTPAVTAALAYGLFQTVLLAALALAWTRLDRAARAATREVAGWGRAGGRMAGKL